MHYDACAYLVAVVRSHSDRAAVVVDSLDTVDQVVVPVEEADLAAAIVAPDLAAVIKFEISSNGSVFIRYSDAKKIHWFYLLSRCLRWL